ncbi:MAG TPA: ATP synthase F1 subunit delta [Gaiellaceae bacterium]|nr:ATP synthase F1 subunit delta [Gaiellaceae bacterium]
MALSGSAARRYAEAMYDLAGEAGAVAAYRSSLDNLAQAFAGGPLRTLRDPSIPMQKRVDAAMAAAAGEPRPIAGLLQLLVRKDRVGLLPAIARAFSDLVDRRAGIAKAVITTAVELDEAQRRDMVERLEKASGKQIKATFGVDASLIGGARVQVGDHLIDGSIRAQLETLRTQLAQR